MGILIDANILYMAIKINQNFLTKPKINSTYWISEYFSDKFRFMVKELKYDKSNRSYKLIKENPLINVKKRSGDSSLNPDPILSLFADIVVLKKFFNAPERKEKTNYFEFLSMRGILPKHKI